MRVPHATAGDSGDNGGNFGGAFEGRTRIHAVAGDISVEDGAHTVSGELAGEVQDVPAALLLPTMGRHGAVARVNGHDEGVAQSFYGPQPELTVEDRRRSHYDADGSSFLQASQVLERADTAADLEWNVYNTGDFTYEIQLYRTAFSGAVEVHDVYGSGALSLPLPGTPHRVRVILLLAAEVALLEPDAPAVLEIYGRVDGEARQSARAQPRKFP